MRQLVMDACIHFSRRGHGKVTVRSRRGHAGTDPVAGEQEPEGLQLAEVHGGGLEAEPQVSGQLPAQTLLHLRLSGGGGGKTEGAGSIPLASHNTQYYHTNTSIVYVTPV